MAPKIVTLFEHQRLLYRAAEALPGDPARLNALLEEIERLNRSCGVEILRLGRKELRAGSLVGVLRAGEITFEILPKIEEQGPGQQPRDAARQTAARHFAVRNLLAMLNAVYDLPLYPLPAAGLDEISATWLELLTRMFVNELLLQAQAGLSQSYTTREDTLPVMRGRWDIQRQILQHGAAQHQFDSVYDDLTADVPLNRVFRYAVETLLLFSQDAQNRALLGSLRDLFQDVAALPEAPLALLEQITFTRLNERFRPAFHLARMFLSGSILRLSTGAVPAAAFVFDMNLLFERFVAAFIERHRQAVLPESWKEARIQVQSAGARYYLAREEGRPQVLLRPDLIFWQRGARVPLLVADTKYKTFQSTAGRADLDPADIYQMMAYALRLNCSRALLLYPQAARGKPQRILLEIESARMALYAATLNLHAPLDPPDALIAELREIFQTAAREEKP